MDIKYDFGFDEYIFRPSEKDLYEAILEIFSNEYGISGKTAFNIIEKYDLQPQLEEDFAEDIKDYFFCDAKLSFEEDK